MRLIPKEIEAILPALYSQEHVHDPVAVVKFFDPYERFTFYVSKARRDSDGDLLPVAYVSPPDYSEPRPPAAVLN